jgi:hypothetical protein
MRICPFLGPPAVTCRLRWALSGTVRPRRCRLRLRGAAIAARVARPGLSPVASVRDNPLAQQGRQ